MNIDIHMTRHESTAQPTINQYTCEDCMFVTGGKNNLAEHKQNVHQIASSHVKTFCCEKYNFESNQRNTKR